MLWTQLIILFFSMLTSSWLSKHPGHPPNTPWPPWHPWTLSLAFFGSLWLSQACSGSYCSLNLLKNPFWLTNQSPAAIAFQMCPKWSQSVPEWSKSTFQVFWTMFDLSTHFWKSWEKVVLRGWRHPRSHLCHRCLQPLKTTFSKSVQKCLKVFQRCPKVVETLI